VSFLLSRNHKRGPTSERNKFVARRYGLAGSSAMSRFWHSDISLHGLQILAPAAAPPQDISPSRVALPSLSNHVYLIDIDVQLPSSQEATPSLNSPFFAPFTGSRWHFVAKHLLPLREQIDNAHVRRLLLVYAKLHTPMCRKCSTLRLAFRNSRVKVGVRHSRLERGRYG
jgi:hypothetical protein